MLNRLTIYKISKSEEPYKCPSCNSDNLTDMGTEYETGALIRVYHCEDCGFMWTETYVFKEWEEVTE